jgi:hypothetical protein
LSRNRSAAEMRQARPERREYRATYPLRNRHWWPGRRGGSRSPIAVTPSAPHRRAG